jgi:hypothetical protein
MGALNQDSDAHTYSVTTTSGRRPPWTPTSPASCRGPTAVWRGLLATAAVDFQPIGLGGLYRCDVRARTCKAYYVF